MKRQGSRRLVRRHCSVVKKEKWIDRSRSFRRILKNNAWCRRRIVSINHRINLHWFSTKQIRWTDSRSGHIAECPSHPSVLPHGDCSPLVSKIRAEREIYWKDYSAVPPSSSSSSSSSSSILYSLPVEIFEIRRSFFCWIEKLTRESSSTDRRIWCSTITSG